MSFTLRIIPDDCHFSSFNMAADLMLLAACEEPSCNIVFLRTYGWNPPAVSLGCMQQADTNLDLDKLKSDGVQWVKRPTGGRAIFHANDITYSCAFPTTLSEMGSSISSSYERIAECLKKSLHILNIDCETEDVTPTRDSLKPDVKLPCFLSANKNELLVNGKKLVGSAQKRTSRAVLQHGSIPISTTYRTLPDYLKISPVQQEQQTASLLQKSISLAEILPDIDFRKATTALHEGFVQTLTPDTVTIQAWTAAELTLISSYIYSIECSSPSL